jgi:nicotinamide riboside kinase
MKKTLVINLFGGPGSGKSTLCALVFGKLKMMGVNCEMATEYVKDIVWEESFKKMENQIYIFGKQHSRVNRLLGKVDIIITDSPLLNSVVYDISKNPYLKDLVIYEFKNLNTLNFYVKRKFDYRPDGRVQDLDQAREVDIEYLNLIKENNIQFYDIESGDVDKVINTLQNNNMI